jgi:hypothetical protein
MKMTTQSCNVDSLQAHIIWRALWQEIDNIERELDARVMTEAVAYNEHLSTIAMLRQINVRFHIVKDSTFEEMVAESALRERKWA